MSATYFDLLTASRILPKLICWFVDHPDDKINMRPLCLIIGEDPGAAHKHFRRLEKVGLLQVSNISGRPFYSLDPGFLLLPEFREMVRKSR